MKVPNCTQALVPVDKIKRYLLNQDHPDGGTKARFFLQKGFDAISLKNTLLIHICENEYSFVEINGFGTKYIVENQIHSPSGDSFKLRSIWIILKGDKIPRLITAYPN